jgi:hypothetical protein
LKSIEKYLIQDLDNMDDLPLETKISRANNNYKKAQGASQDKLMDMRAGYIDGCFDSTTCIKNNITNIHNKLKLLEQHGHNGYLGDSCIGVEYRLRKLRLTSLKQSSKK